MNLWKIHPDARTIGCLPSAKYLYSMLQGAHKGLYAEINLLHSPKHMAVIKLHLENLEAKDSVYLRGRRCPEKLIPARYLFCHICGFPILLFSWVQFRWRRPKRRDHCLILPAPKELYSITQHLKGLGGMWIIWQGVQEMLSPHGCTFARKLHSFSALETVNFWLCSFQEKCRDNSGQECLQLLAWQGALWMPTKGLWRSILSLWWNHRI